MERQELDATLDRLRRAREAIATNLLELEAHPTAQTLERVALVGASRERWERARVAVGDLWQQYTQLGAVLDDASRRRPGDGERARLLTGACIELALAQEPVSQRSLLTFGRRVVTCTPDELLEQMAHSFAKVQATVSEVGTVWEQLLPRVTDARGHLVASEDRSADARDLVTALDDLAGRMGADPLSVTELEVERLTARVAQIVATRVSYAAELERAYELLEELSTAETRDAATVHRAQARIVFDPELEVPTSEWTHLSRTLDDVDSADALAAWERDARRALDGWRRCVATSAAALARRDELRGRLDAYRTLAMASGHEEDVAAAELHEAASDALHLAPVDLDHAERLVHEYQLRSTDDGAP